MNIVSVLPLAVLAILIAIFLANRRNAELSCVVILRRLHPHQLAYQDRYLGEDAHWDVRFWMATGGILGLWRRWRNRAVFVQLCQLRTMHNDPPTEDLKFVTARASEMTFLTFKAAVAATVRFAAPAIADRTAFHAFQIYAELAHATYVYFADEDAHMCAHHLSALL